MSNRKEIVSIRMALLGAFFCLFTMGSVCAQNMDWAPPNSSEFSNTANVIAEIYLNDIEIDNPGDQIAFFVGDEIRGLSTPILVGSSEYVHFVTIYSNQAVEEMDIRVYSQSQDLVFDLGEIFRFETGGISGSVDSPLILNVYEDNDYPISFNSVPDQVTLEGLSFDDIDMNSYLVQVDDNDIEWSYTFNANLVVGISNGILNVEGASGYSGTTTLTVRATKLPFNSFAETEIVFTITPFYEGPAWYNIPPQSIVIGDQFDPVDLHNYEYQYGGPAIQYDYAPVLNPSKNPDPMPNWVVNSKLEVNMNFIFRLNYTPKHQFNHEDDMLVAFKGAEVRGVTTVDAESGLFFLTVGGMAGESESIHLQFYSGEKKQIFSLNIFYQFRPYQILGSVDDPLVMDLAPIVPSLNSQPIPGGILVVPIDIVDPTFIGIEHFKFFAFDPLYPDDLHADTTTSFCVTADAGDLATLYADSDLDGLGDPNIFIQACEGILNFVPNADDCDDTNYLECAADITVSNDPGVCEATGVSLLEPNFNDCHVTSITNDAPEVYPLGTTLVRWTVVFNDIAIKYCFQMVTVIDDEAPVPNVGGINVDWEEVGAFTAIDAQFNQQYGFDVDMSNDWAIVGARYDNDLGTEAGAAYVLWNDNGTWQAHSKLLASNGEKNDEFGTAVSISENRILVGAPGNDLVGQEAGAAYIFEYNGTDWIETSVLTAQNPSNGDLFGGAVSIDGDYAAIGSVQEDSLALNSGAVYVFEYKSSWVENAILKANDAESDDDFGYDVSVSGNQIIVGARLEDADGIDAGAAYVFERNDDFGIWSQIAKLIVNNPEAGSEFGTSVDISGNHAVIGSPKNDLNGLDYGVALIYSKIGGAWVEEQVIQPDSLHPLIEFGTSVSISANYLVAGAPINLSSIPGQGGAFVYRNDDMAWTIQSSVLASNSEIEDFFGSSVAIFGHTAIVGAPGMDNVQSDEGQSYMFHLNAGLPLNDSACDVEFDLPTALDNCDGEIEGIVEETSDYMGLGIFEVKWSYTDSAGNTTFQYQMLQTLIDTIPPTISCPTELTLLLDETGNLTVEIADSLFTSSDNCGNLTVDYFPSSLDCSDIGTTIVQVIVSDAMGNQASCEIDVTLQEGPKIVTNLSNNQPGSLRKLIEGSCGGAESIIYFDTTLNGTIQLFTNQILIDKDIEIVGLGKDTINIDPNYTMRIFEITPSSTVTLRGLQLSKGEEVIEGGAILNNGILNLDNIRFIDNKEGGTPKAFTNNGQIYIIEGLVEVRE